MWGRGKATLERSVKKRIMDDSMSTSLKAHSYVCVETSPSGFVPFAYPHRFTGKGDLDDLLRTAQCGSIFLTSEEFRHQRG